MKGAGEDVGREIELKRRTPEESREYLMEQIAKLLYDRRELLETSKAVAKWLEDYPNNEGGSLEDAYERWTQCIRRIDNQE